MDCDTANVFHQGLGLPHCCRTSPGSPPCAAAGNLPPSFPHSLQNLAELCCSSGQYHPMSSGQIHPIKIACRPLLHLDSLQLPPPGALPERHIPCSPPPAGTPGLVLACCALPPTKPPGSRHLLHIRAEALLSACQKPMPMNPAREPAELEPQVLLIPWQWYSVHTLLGSPIMAPLVPQVGSGSGISIIGNAGNAHLTGITRAACSTFCLCVPPPPSCSGGNKRKLGVPSAASGLHDV